jgi:hypothetical protein
MAEGVCGVQFTVGPGQNCGPVESPSLGSHRDERVPLENPEYNKVLHLWPCRRHSPLNSLYLRLFFLNITLVPLLGLPPVGGNVVKKLENI